MLETISYTNASTGVTRYTDVPTGVAMQLLEAGIGDRVRFDGEEFTVMDGYMACVELGNKRRVIVVDLAADASPDFATHLQRVSA